MFCQSALRTKTRLHSKTILLITATFSSIGIACNATSLCTYRETRNCLMRHIFPGAKLNRFILSLRNVYTQCTKYSEFLQNRTFYLCFRALRLRSVEQSIELSLPDSISIHDLLIRAEWKDNSSR